LVSVLTRPRAPRLIAAVQAVITVLVVLAAAHHRAEVRHADDAAAEADVGFECDRHARDAAISSSRSAGVESGTCLLCLAAHAPTALAAPPAWPTPTATAAPASIARAADPPPRAAAIWRTAPKTSPPV
jgi:hypothetical protein